MKKIGILAAIVLVLQLVLPFSLNASAEETSEALNYLALGDSLAAGMNDKGEIGYGYADYIAKNYGEDGVQFNKGFSYPGYTTENVLNDIQANVTKPIYDLNGESTKTMTIKQAIQEADFITLSAGANDVLKYASRSETGEFSFDVAGVLKGIQDVAKNYEKIFTSIYAINPDVDIIVMGLYNPFPHYKDAAIQTQLNTLVSTINNSIKTVVEKNNGVFSEVADLIASNVTEYLPNPANIHLSTIGYEQVAFAMLEDYFATILADSEEGITDVILKEDASFADISNHWGKEYIDIAYTNGYMKGYDDGTFKPNANMTRAQVLSVISRAFGLTPKNPSPFKDISQYAQQTQDEIVAAYEAGLVRENDGYFNPQGNITRSQLALILMRLSNAFVGTAYDPAITAPFKDLANI